MPRLIWSRRALADVDRLHAFLKAKNPDAAMRVVRAIRSGARLLGDHPQAGRPAEVLPTDFREWPIEFGRDGYVSLYRYDGADVVILAIRHGRESGF